MQRVNRSNIVGWLLVALAWGGVIAPPICQARVPLAPVFPTLAEMGSRAFKEDQITLGKTALNRSVAMLALNTKARRTGSSGAIKTKRFWAAYIGIIATVVGIDLLLGEKAEFYNAAATLQQLGHVASFGVIPEAKWQYIAGQERLGKWALPISTAITLGVPFAVSYLVAKKTGE